MEGKQRTRSPFGYSSAPPPCLRIHDLGKTMESTDTLKCILSLPKQYLCLFFLQWGRRIHSAPSTTTNFHYTYDMLHIMIFVHLSWNFWSATDAVYTHERLTNKLRIYKRTDRNSSKNRDKTLPKTYLINLSHTSANNLSFNKHKRTNTYGLIHAHTKIIFADTRIYVLTQETNGLRGASKSLTKLLDE